MQDIQKKSTSTTLLSSLGALAVCTLLGAVLTGVPFALLRRTKDPLGAPFQPMAVYVLQGLALIAAWRVCVVRKFPWLSKEWSPWAIGFMGPVTAFLILGIQFLCSKEPLPINHIFGALIGLFWLWGWIPTMVLGFIGGAFVGFIGMRDRRDE